MFKLFIAFLLLYILFLQGRYVYMEIYRFFKAQRKKNNPDVTITRISPKAKKQNDKGEYVDYEEIS